MFPLLYFDNAAGVARALVELLLAVSMVTGSHGAGLVQPVSVSRVGGGGGCMVLLEYCLLNVASFIASSLH